MKKTSLGQLKGRGDYKMSQDEAAAVITKAVKSAVGAGIKRAGAAVGAKAGGMLGLKGPGKKLGLSMASKLSRLIGTGDYQTNAGDVVTNSLFTGSRGVGSTGTFETMTGGVRLKHREYVQDIFTSATAGSTFTNNSWVVNPGLSYVFPYLAQIAANFEQYRFHGLVFEFVSSTAPYGVTALGTYVMAMEYNAQAPLFLTKPQMENSDYAMSARLDKCGMYGIECAPQSQAQTYYYVRAPGITTPANLADTGIMQLGVATTTVASGTGIIAGSAIGELWVTYDVELIRPRISNSRYGYLHSRASGATNANPLGTSWSSNVYGALTGTVIAGTTIDFPNASIGDFYSVNLYWLGTATAGITFPTPTLTNMLLVNILSNNTTSAATTTPAVAGGDRLAATYYIQVTNEQPAVPRISFGTAGTLPTGCTLDIIVTDLGNGFNAGTL